MPQETKKIKAHDGKDIVVEVNAAEGNTCGVLIIHGFTGNIQEHVFYNAAQSWPKKGLDVWRIALYPGEIENTRKMSQVTWEENLADIRLALKEMENAYEQIFIVGHSMGGTTAVYVSSPRIKAKVLWDPSYYTDSGDVLDPELHPDYFTIDWGHTILVSKKYTQEAIQATKFDGVLPPQPPLLVIRASETKESWPQDRLKAKLATIPNSDHCFNNEGNETLLFKETLKFFKKYSTPALT